MKGLMLIMRRKILSVVMCVCMACSFVGCASGTKDGKDSTNNSKSSKSEEATAEDKSDGESGDDSNAQSDAEDSAEVVKLEDVSQIENFVVEYTDADEIPDWKNENTSIELKGMEVTVDGQGAAFKNNTISISKAGYYVISGKLDDGKIVIEADKKEKVYLILNGADISCSNDAVINEIQADKVIITAVDGTENVLSDGETHTDEELTAAVYCKDSLTINGTGKLTVNGNFKDAITSKDKLKIIGSDVSVVAEDDGLVGKDLVAIKSGNINVDSMGDGIKSSETTDVEKGIICVDGGSININSELDAIQAENFVRINGGELKLVTGGSSANDSSTENSDSTDGNEDSAGNNAKDSSDENNSEDINSMDADAVSIDIIGEIPADSVSDMQMPEGEMPTGDMDMPTGDMQMPDGEMPTGGMQRPDGMEMPTGGMQRPDGMEMPTGGMQRPNRGDFEFETDENGEPVWDESMMEEIRGEGGNRGNKGQGGWGNWGGMNNQNNSDENAPSAKAIKGGNGVYITGGTIGIDSSDDAIHANDMVYILGGTIDISSGDDGIHADTTLDISGGTINISKSYEGIESYTINISGGEVEMVASDDGINAAGGVDGSSTNGRMGQNRFSAGDTGAGVNVSGGSVHLTAYGDGIDSNGSITMTDGTVIICGPENSGNGSIDYAGEFIMDGGTLLAAGPAGMFMSIGENSKQNVINVNLSGSSGDVIKVLDGDKTIAEFTAETRYTTVIISVPELEEGKRYTIKYGDKETSAEAEKGQYYRGL